MAKKKKGTSVYKIITDRIIEMLDKGVVPWRKPWQFTMHYNAHTKNQYNGVNIMILDAVAMLENYSTPIWCTYRQAKKLGGTIQEDAWDSDTIIVFYKWIKEKDEDGEYTGNEFPYLQYSKVFNADQIDWEDESVLDTVIPETKVPNANTKVDPDTFMFEHMKNPVEVQHGGNSACYWPKLDKVGMPNPQQFESDNEYYSTLFHEVVHATGHESRLGRFMGKSDETRFGSGSYSKEELIAEFGAAFLCAEFDIEDERVLENSAAYIQGWKAKLSDNPNMLTSAGSKAKKAVKYILGQ